MSRTFGWVVVGALIGTTLFAYGQESSPLGVIAGIVAQKGFKDFAGGQVCERFHLQGRISDGKCAFEAIAGDDDERIDGYEAGIETYIEQGTQKRWIILRLMNVKKRRAYSFLTDDNGTLQQAISGTLDEKRLWQWSPAAIDDDIKSRYAKVLAFWLSPHLKKELDDIK
jgi:hypothetical protein